MAGRKRSDADTETVLMVEQEKRNLELLKEQQQADRERMIAQCHEVIGRVQANSLMVKFGAVSNLVHLKNIKESKIYRDLPMVGTWEEFCKYLGLDRRTVDEDLQNLAAFGEDFLETSRQLSVGYRDLRKLRHLTNDGTITIDGEAIVINDERIPLDADHKEDLQAAIEGIIEGQARMKEEIEADKKANRRVQELNHKQIVKLQKENDQFLKKAEARGLSLEEDAFITQVVGFRDLAQGALIALDPNAEDNIIPSDLSLRMKTSVISAIYNLKMQTSALYDTVMAQIGDPTICPEMLEDYAKWEAENGYKAA